MPEDPLQIAIVAPPFYEIPPSGYGGIEAVVALLVGRPGRPRSRRHADRGRPGRDQGAGSSNLREPQWPRLGQAEPELLHAARVSGLLADLAPDVVHDHSAHRPGLRP